MAPKSKPSSLWGDLNVALNALVRERVIAGYKTGLAESDAKPAIEVTIDKGADQAEVVRRVRQSLPDAFSQAMVRTRIA